MTMDIAAAIAELHELIKSSDTWAVVQAKVRETVDLLDCDAAIPDDLLSVFTQEQRENLLTSYLFSIDAIARSRLGQPEAIRLHEEEKPHVEPAINWQRMP